MARWQGKEKTRGKEETVNSSSQLVAGTVEFVWKEEGGMSERQDLGAVSDTGRG